MYYYGFFLDFKYLQKETFNDFTTLHNTKQREDQSPRQSNIYLLETNLFCFCLYYNYTHYHKSNDFNNFLNFFFISPLFSPPNISQTPTFTNQIP